MGRSGAHIEMSSANEEYFCSIMANMIWITLLQIFGAGFIGGAGVALGAWLNQRGAAAIAKHTLEGQRILARDASLRDWRKQQIAPYIEAAINRTRIWVEIHNARGTNDKVIADRIRFLTLGERLMDPHFDNLIVTYPAIPDDAFRAAFQNFVNAEGDHKLTRTYTKEEIMDVIMRMRLALVDLNEATEHFIYLR